MSAIAGPGDAEMRTTATTKATTDESSTRRMSQFGTAGRQRVLALRHDAIGCIFDPELGILRP
jgi:hypothetical protein